MIFGIGIDIIEVKRIGNNLSNGNFLKKIFTEKEIELYKNLANNEQKFAVRFAAKEAFMKALGTGWRNGVKFNEIEILTETNGKPFVKLYGKSKIICQRLEIKKIHISLSHIKDIAIAFVILEK